MLASVMKTPAGNTNSKLYQNCDLKNTLVSESKWAFCEERTERIIAEDKKQTAK